MWTAVAEVAGQFSGRADAESVGIGPTHSIVCAKKADRPIRADGICAKTSGRPIHATEIGDGRKYDGAAYRGRANWYGRICRGQMGDTP